MELFTPTITPSAFLGPAPPPEECDPLLLFTLVLEAAEVLDAFLPTPDEAETALAIADAPCLKALEMPPMREFAEDPLPELPEPLPVPPPLLLPPPPMRDDAGC